MTADWDNYGEWLFWAPHVIRYIGLYYMFVCAGNNQGHQYKTHWLTSQDLWHWERRPVNPLLTDGFDARDPNVLRGERTFRERIIRLTRFRSTARAPSPRLRRSALGLETDPRP